MIMLNKNKNVQFEMLEIYPFCNFIETNKYLGKSYFM